MNTEDEELPAVTAIAASSLDRDVAPGALHEAPLPDSRQERELISRFATAFQAAGKLPEAIVLYQQVRDARVKNLEADHPSTLTTLNNLGRAYKDTGKLPEALLLFEKAATGVREGRFQHEHAGRIIPNTIAAYEAAKAWDRVESWRRA